MEVKNKINTALVSLQQIKTMTTTKLDAVKEVMIVMRLNVDAINYMTSEMKVCNVTRLWSICENQYDKIVQKSAVKFTKIDTN